MKLNKFKKYIEENPTAGKPLSKGLKRDSKIKLPDKLKEKMKDADKMIEEFNEVNENFLFS